MTVKSIDLRRCALGAGVIAAAWLAVACGGGEQVATFKAKRVLAFGDETSLIVDVNGNGLKYGINGTVSTTNPALDCRINMLWIQRVAGVYNLVFPQCNNSATPVVSPVSRIRAALGAKAADLATQIDAQQADSSIGDGDISTVVIGENDVLAQYAQYPGLSEDAITANLEAAGVIVGEQVNRLADAGSKVLISTIPDVGITPFAAAEKLAHTDTDRAALLTRLSQHFNAKLRGTIYNDGRRIGLILLDELVSAVGKYNGLNGFNNTSVGACDLTRSTQVPPSVLDCSDLTLITGAGSNSYLWADDRHLSAGGQASFGSLAVTRAQNNPF
ncbi:MAG: SGNH/GDSL hydrolase family protein [Caldimonas sp.]